MLLSVTGGWNKDSDEEEEEEEEESGEAKSEVCSNIKNFSATKFIAGGRKEKSKGENASNSRYCSIDPGAIKREKILNIYCNCSRVTLDSLHMCWTVSRMFSTSVFPSYLGWLLLLSSSSPLSSTLS